MIIVRCQGASVSPVVSCICHILSLCFHLNAQLLPWFAKKVALGAAILGRMVRTHWHMVSALQVRLPKANSLTCNNDLQHLAFLNELLLMLFFQTRVCIFGT